METYKSSLVRNFIIISILSSLVNSYPINSTLQPTTTFNQTAIYQWQISRTSWVDKSCHTSNLKNFYSQSETSCLSLEELLEKPNHLDTSFFALNSLDLFYSGILNGTGVLQKRDSKTLPSAQIESQQNKSCSKLLQEITVGLKTRSGNCAWKYDCKFNPHYFPSVTILAHLTVGDYDSCIPVVLPRTKFVKVPRRNHSQQDCWFPCNVRPRIGFKQYLDDDK